MITDEHLDTAATEHLAINRPLILAGTPLEDALTRDEIDADGTRRAMRRTIEAHGMRPEAEGDVPAYAAGFYDGLAIGVRAARLESFA